SILECEKLVKAAYRNNGLVYRESSSEDEGGGGRGQPSEVIEIDDDEDDDVIAVGCCKSHPFCTARSDQSLLLETLTSLFLSFISGSPVKDINAN
ncbi:hypothetical protein GOODEAATRI_002116, partial [Goodea atripinnis]